MKICIPTSGKNGLHEPIHDHFGSALYFTIYDTDNKSIEVVANLNNQHENGSCIPTQSLEEKNVDIVISGGMGTRAISMLNMKNIKAFKLIETTTFQLAIEKFNNGELREITLENACRLHDASEDGSGE